MKGDRRIDKHFTLDAMTDLANEYGDQYMIEVMLEWLHNKMGSEWIITQKD